MRTARFLGNRTLIELLDSAGASFETYLASLDLDSRTAHVSWAGDEPVALWLDVAREFTERWVHQQQIRDAAGRPGAEDPALLGSVLRTFVHALPTTYRDVGAPVGTAVELRVTGGGGGAWHVVREERAWRLVGGSHPAPTAVVTMDDDSAWRLFTRNPHRRPLQVQGDGELARVMERACAIVA